MSFSNLKEQFINSKELKTNWKLFKKIFGNEIDILFVNDYDKRITLYKSLVSLYNKEFNKSYHAMRHLLQCCNNEEKEIIGRIINLTYNEEEMSKVKIGDYLKRDNAGGYYLVVDKINDKTVIKNCFDFEFNYSILVPVSLSNRCILFSSTARVTVSSALAVELLSTLAISLSLPYFI